MKYNRVVGARVIAILAVAAAFCVAAGVARADNMPVKGTIYGYSKAGMMIVVGQALAKAVREEFPGSSISYEPGNPIGGLKFIAEGKHEFSMITPTELVLATQGKQPFPRKYSDKDYAVVARVFEGLVFHIYGRKDFLDKHGINSLADIKKNKIAIRVSTNQRGNAVMQTSARMMLKYYGFGYDDIKNWGGQIIYQATRGSNALMRDNKIDLLITGTPAGSGQVKRLINSTPVRFLPLDNTLLDKLVDELRLEHATIGAGTYPGLISDYRTAALAVLILAGRQVAEETTYKVAKGLYNKFEAFRTTHRAFSKLNRKMLARSGGFPIHPGANRFYKEVGLVN